MPSVKTGIKVAAPGYPVIVKRHLTVLATRGGVGTGAYKELIVQDYPAPSAAKVIVPLRDGLSATHAFAASAIDGRRMFVLQDFDAQPYAVIRLLNVDDDLSLQIDLNDGTGGGSAEPTEPARIPAIVRHDGSPAIREVVAVERRTDGSWRFAGSTLVEESGDLSLQVTGGEVYAFGVDDYGIRFQANGAVEIGQAIRPTVFEGWLYQVTEAGTLPATEPQWWPIQGDNAAREVGTARLQAIRYYQPIGHGPVNYELIP